MGLEFLLLFASLVAARSRARMTWLKEADEETERRRNGGVRVRALAAQLPCSFHGAARVRAEPQSNET